MGKINIESVKYVHFEGKVCMVNATIDGITMSVPLDLANRHYAEIMRQVKAGTLVIQPADEPEQPEEN